MIYVIPIASLLYGLLLHYELFIPKIYHGSAIGNILFGILFLIAIPFLKRLEKNEKNQSFSSNYFCFGIYVLGSVLIVVHLYELYDSDLMFISAIVIMAFCQSSVTLINKLKKKS